MFRFTIRDVLWLMVVVAMWCAWRLDLHRRDFELNEMDLLRKRNNSLRTAFRVTGYEIQETNDGGAFVTRKPDDETGVTMP